VTIAALTPGRLPVTVLAATKMLSGHGKGSKRTNQVGPGNPKGTAGLHLGSEVGMDRLGELFDDLLTLKMV
jgi:hypothetical protein